MRVRAAPPRGIESRSPVAPPARPGRQRARPVAAFTAQPHLREPLTPSTGSISGQRGWEPLEASCSSSEQGSDLGWRSGLDRLYAKGKVLGQGSFGCVYTGVHLETGREAAIKELPKVRGKLTKEKTLEKLQREVDILERMQECRRVVQLDDLFEDDNSVYLVTEICAGGDLQRFSDVYGCLNEKCLAQIALEVLKIIKSCHDFSVIHGDVKPANFCLKEEHLNPLCSSDAALRRSPWLKAIDFGCSQLHSGAPRLTKRSGTPVYMAPEIFQRSYSFEVDMWSLGVMLYQLYSRRFPFWEGDSYSRALSLDEVARAVSESPIRYDYGPWQQMSADGLDFIRSCLTRDPAQRLAVEDALCHPWLTAKAAGQQEGSAAGVPPVSNNIAPFANRRDAAVAA